MSTSSRCCVPFCDGSYERTFVKIGETAWPKLKKWPCNFLKEDIKVLKVANNTFICKAHLKEYIGGEVNASFVLHDVNTDPIVTAMLKGTLQPQVGYLIRTGSSAPKFLEDLRRKRANSFPPLAMAPSSTPRLKRKSKEGDDDDRPPEAPKDADAEVLRLQTLLVAANESTKSANKKAARLISINKQSAQVASERTATINALREEITVLKLSLAETEKDLLSSRRPWSYSSLLEYSDVDFTAIIGLKKDAWIALVALYELHGFPIHWGSEKLLGWQDALTLYQVKLRQNTIYAMLARLFKIVTSSCSKYVREIANFSHSLSVYVMQLDIRATVDQNRINGLRSDRCGLAMSRVAEITDAVSLRVQKATSSEVRSLSHSDYKKDERLKVQASINASGEPSWVSKAYLAFGASDQQILENGESAGSDQFQPRKFFDQLKGNDIVMGDKGTLIRAPLGRHNKRTGKRVSMMLPPFTKNGKLSFDEKVRGREIARTR